MTDPIVTAIQAADGHTMTPTEALARAKHETCKAYWREEAEKDPGRMTTMHEWDAHLPAAEREVPALAAIGYEVRPIDSAGAAKTPDQRDALASTGTNRTPAGTQAAEASSQETSDGALRFAGEQSEGNTSAAADHPHQHTTHTLIDVIDALPRYKSSPEGIISDDEGQWLKFLDVQVVVRKAATLGAPVADSEQAAEVADREAAGHREAGNLEGPTPSPSATAEPGKHR